MNVMEKIIKNEQNSKVGFVKQNRIEQRFAELKKENKKAFITYVTACFPDYEHTIEILFSQEKAGVDVVELGVPFSDPIADGPVIQSASFEAIQKGANLVKTFECVKQAREKGLKMPIIFMLYYNTICFYGIENFIKKCNEVGVDGIIVPDLPFEEQDDLQRAIDKNSKDKTIIIQLVSPVSRDRMDMILKDARGFVYCVSSMGVTGQGGNFHREVSNYLESVKEKTDIPVMLGFGIRTFDDISKLIDKVDGAIVGTHFIEVLRENDFSVDEAYKYSKEFKDALDLAVK